MTDVIPVQQKTENLADVRKCTVYDRLQLNVKPTTTLRKTKREWDSPVQTPKNKQKSVRWNTLQYAETTEKHMEINVVHVPAKKSKTDMSESVSIQIAK